jgi:hypothetical protein
LLIGWSILAFLSTVAVALRLWARKATGIVLRIDDYLAVAALVTQHASLCAGFVMVIIGGVGRDTIMTTTENPGSVVTLFKVHRRYLLCMWSDKALTVLFRSHISPPTSCTGAAQR